MPVEDPGGPYATVRSESRLLGRATIIVCILRRGPGGVSALRPMSIEGALEGIRVLDLSGRIPAAYCGKLFADHGADVILVEPPEGMPTRGLPPFAPGVQHPEASGMHAYLSTNKRSVVLPDSSSLPELARDVSLVIDHEYGSQRPLPVGTLAEVSPDAVLMSITWFGQSGPYKRYKGSDGVCQALTSQIDWLGEPDSAPWIPGGYHAQVTAGVTAFIAGMGQLLAREMGNLGDVGHIDVSIFESALCFVEIDALRGYQGLETRTRLGVNRFRATYPLGIYPCRDGWLGVTVLTPSQWQGFCRLTGLEHLAAQPRYRESLARLQDADSLDPVIAAAVRSHSAADLARRGQALKVPLSIVPTMDEILDVDQYVSREAFVDVSHPELGTLQLPGTPFKLYGMPAKPGGPVARLGRHTDEVVATIGMAT